MSARSTSMPRGRRRHVAGGGWSRGLIPGVLVVLGACTGQLGDRGAGDGDPDPDEAAEAAAKLLTTESQVRRISHSLYRNALEDVFGFDRPLLDAVLLPEDKEVSGFLNSASLGVSYNLARAYFEAADFLAIEAVSNDSVLDHIGASCTGALDACIEQLAGSLGERMFGRELTAAEIDRYRDFAIANAEHAVVDDDYLGAVEMLIQAMLQSPHFVLQLELTDEAGSASSLSRRSPVEIARALAAMIWVSVPDQALIEAARTGALDDAEGITTMARAMLDDPRARRMGSDFFDQLLHTARYHGLDRPSYPITPEIADAMVGEVHAFVEDVIFDQGGDLEALLTSTYTYVNQHNAPIYGLTSSDVELSGDEFVRVELDPERFAGVLTQSGRMASLATPYEPHLIVRGARVLQTFLCQEMEPISIDEDDLAKFTGDTLREQIENGTQSDTCQACHASINGVGFAFGGFDQVGMLRTEDNGFPVDTTGTMFLPPDSALGLPSLEATFEGAPDVAALIATDPRGQHCFAERLMTYSLGIKPDTEDPRVDGIAADQQPVKDQLAKIAAKLIERKLDENRQTMEACQ